MRTCLNWLNSSQSEALVDCRQNLVLHKTLSIDTSISSPLWTGAVEMLVMNKPITWPKDVRTFANNCSQINQNTRSGRQIVSEDTNWIYFRYPNKRHQWLSFGQASELLPDKGGLYRRSCCVIRGISIGWGNLNWFPHAHVVNADLYVQQLQRVHDTLKAFYPSFVKWRPKAWQLTSTDKK